jgi:hypothetical protein
MQRYSGIIVILVLLIGMESFCSAGVWKSYTSKRNVRSVAADNSGTVWAATSGGVFSYRPADSSLTQLTTSEGLRSIDCTSLFSGSDGTVWIGTSEGYVHRYIPSRNSWLYITDIFLQSDPQKRINRLQQSGDTLVISSEIGLLFYSTSRQEFAGTFRRFGPAPGQITGTVTGFAEANGRFWVATRSGIASTAVTNPNPAAPESWSVTSVAQGLPSNLVHALVVSGDTLFAATAAGLCRYDGSAWSVVAGTEGREIVDCSSIAGGTFSFLTASALWRYTVGAVQAPAVDLAGYQCTSCAGDGVIGTASAGLLRAIGTSVTGVIPSGPVSNSFVSVGVDARGVLWAGTGSANGAGIMTFDGKAWGSITAQSEPRLLGNDYYKVNIGRDNSKWISSWGSGVAIFDDGGSLVKVLNTSNGIPMTENSGGNPVFCVVGAAVPDADGVTWILNRAAPDNIAVMQFRPDSTLDSSVTFFRNMLNPITILTDLVIDYNGTKWFANSGRFEPVAAQQLYFYNGQYALPGTTSGWGVMDVSSGLTSKNVWSLAVDRDGELWIGTDAGVSIIYNVGAPASSIVAYHPLRDQVIQCIVVDALNNKWIGTRQGAFELSADGTSILNRYTVENTDGKLLSDDVASIAIDGKTGRVYFGTEKGLSTLSTLAISPRSDFSGLAISPNPLYIPSAAPATVADTIDGLVEYSSIKILSVDGTLVCELPAHSDASPGGRVAVWDGRNQRGEFVATGVYVIVAASDDGSKIATGKIAVIRR